MKFAAFYGSEKEDQIADTKIINVEWVFGLLGRILARSSTNKMKRAEDRILGDTMSDAERAA